MTQKSFPDCFDAFLLITFLVRYFVVLERIAITYASQAEGNGFDARGRHQHLVFRS